MEKLTPGQAARKAYDEAAATARKARDEAAKEGNE